MPSAHLVASTVADHDEEGTVVGLDPIGDESRDTGVELLPHDGGCVVAEGSMAMEQLKFNFCSMQPAVERGGIRNARRLLCKILNGGRG